MITDTIYNSDFVGNETIRAAFSYEAANALYAYLMDFSDDIGEDIEFDPVAFRCEWSEYSFDELMNDYGHMLDDDQEPEDLPEVLEQHTTIIKLKGIDSFLVMAF